MASIETVQGEKTLELSPKAVLAFVYPLIAGLAVVVAHWVITGQFDETEVRLILGDFGLAAVASLGAYLGKPGLVEGPRVGGGGAR